MQINFRNFLNNCIPNLFNKFPKLLANNLVTEGKGLQKKTFSLFGGDIPGDIKALHLVPLDTPLQHRVRREPGQPSL